MQNEVNQEDHKVKTVSFTLEVERYLERSSATYCNTIYLDTNTNVCKRSWEDPTVTVQEPYIRHNLSVFASIQILVSIAILLLHAIHIHL